MGLPFLYKTVTKMHQNVTLEQNTQKVKSPHFFGSSHPPGPRRNLKKSP